MKKKQVQEENPIPVIKMSDVEEKVVQWLWYPFIPFGKVTLIQGNPGKGKHGLQWHFVHTVQQGENFQMLFQSSHSMSFIKPQRTVSEIRSSQDLQNVEQI